MSGKTHKCYNCQRDFAVSRKNGRIILMLIVCIILIAFNIIVLYSSKNINLPVMIISNAACVFAAIFIFPFTVRFKPIKITKSMKKRGRQA